MRWESAYGADLKRSLLLTGAHGYRDSILGPRGV